MRVSKKDDIARTAKNQTWRGGGVTGIRGGWQITRAQGGGVSEVAGEKKTTSVAVVPGSNPASPIMFLMCCRIIV